MVDAFMERLNADDDLRAIAVVLQPYRAMMGDPEVMAYMLDALAAHWAAARGGSYQKEAA
jgi:hypothetical protein